jgi:hypothetical protein
MPNTVCAVVHNGKIEPLEELYLQEGCKLLVTVLDSTEESGVWWKWSEPSLADVWGNPQDDIYAELLTT